MFVFSCLAGCQIRVSWRQHQGMRIPLDTCDMAEGAGDRAKAGV